MSREPEQRLWDRMRERAELYGTVMRRIENFVDVGMPDVLVLRDGHVTMCELKSRPTPPARPDTPLLGAKYGLSNEQRNWLLEWTRHGGRSLVIAGCAREVFAISGAFAAEVNALPLQGWRAAHVGWRKIAEALE